jgi:thiol:disulfide interchange protein DsbC
MSYRWIQVVTLLLAPTLSCAATDTLQDMTVPAAVASDVSSDDHRLSLNGDASAMQQARAVARQVMLAGIPRDRRVIFNAVQPVKHRVTVFTDIDCPYCRRFHQQIEDYLRAGIEVQYVFYPRAGPDSPAFAKAVAVWCSEDRRAALALALNDGVLPLANCDNPVAEQYELAVRLGLLGTPALITENGAVMYGAMPVSRLLSRLEAPRGAGPN